MADREYVEPTKTSMIEITDVDEVEIVNDGDAILVRAKNLEQLEKNQCTLVRLSCLKGLSFEVQDTDHDGAAWFVAE